MLENVRVCYFLNYVGQAVPIFRLSMRKTAFTKLQPSCQWFITVNPGRSERDSGRDICGSSNEIRQIRWTIADMYKACFFKKRQLEVDNALPLFLCVSVFISAVSSIVLAGLH